MGADYIFTSLNLNVNKISKIKLKEMNSPPNLVLYHMVALAKTYILQKLKRFFCPLIIKKL